MAREDAGGSAMPPQTLWSRRLKEFSADNPKSLDDYIKTAWLLSYLTLLPLTRARELVMLLRAFLGSQTIKQLILDGTAPEDLATEEEDPWPAAAQEIRGAIFRADAIVLDLSLVQIKAQIDAATDDDNLLHALKTFVRVMESRAPMRKVTLSRVDYSEAFDFAQEQIDEGGLKNIPSWQVKPWKQRMQRSLNTMQQRFERTVDGHSAWDIAHDGAIIAATPGAELRRLICKVDVTDLHLPSSEFGKTLLTEATIMNTALDGLAFRNLKRDLRTDLADCVKQVGNASFEKGQLQTSKRLYELLRDAWSNDPACCVNLAAVHLRMGKDRDNIDAAYNAAIIGLQMVSRVPPSDILDGDGSVAFKQRCYARAIRNEVWLENKGLLPSGHPSIRAHSNYEALAGQQCRDKSPKSWNVTRRFTCREKQLDSLECKAWVRSARANAALAKILCDEMRGPSSKLPHGDARIAQVDSDRATLIKSGLQAYERALQIEPGNVPVCIEKERLALEIDNSNPAHRLAKADTSHTTTLHGNASEMSQQRAAALQTLIAQLATD